MRLYKQRSDVGLAYRRLRENKPASPHLNAKVERVQKTGLDEFYATPSLNSPTLEQDLCVWLMDYNYHRFHGSLGKTPMQLWAEPYETTPYWDDVNVQFDPEKEADHVDQLTLRRRAVKPSKYRKDGPESRT